ncbi:class II aldolase and Adducin N-terminal domain-containing protein [Pseudomassariella vexata]|uniref:Class II aldolase and Adducin N-terminal domain-domain-containing protein n=1 Tax=Pseudomassariella vexata TaxID=1141098 RepID=A0A1Y2D9E0_9PEZI|nr:class II aldolase and Adducin N-terminal domain-containing protein [Pseudomassariella vexata]ORY55879.1 class II aldolase and Adducin N-terminal domain-domain-containing protein [Pseudomassariella vexata]
MDTEASQAGLLTTIYRKLITGSHILHYHNVLDAYGHLSCRHPFKPDLFIMSRESAPAIISSPADLVHYHISDASPVDPNSPKGFSERHIHSEIYKAYPSLQSVIHSHTDSVIPYTITGIPLRPCSHMAGFLGHWAPVFDIASAYQPSDAKDMLVRNEHLGAALAKCFEYNQTVVLMRGHGFTVVTDSKANAVEECVSRAVYTMRNAAIQTAALTMQAAYARSEGEKALVQPIKYLSPQEAEAAQGMSTWSVGRPWGLWVREVEACGFYINSA